MTKEKPKNTMNIDTKLRVNLTDIMDACDGNLLNLCQPATHELDGSMTVPNDADEAFMLAPARASYKPLQSLSRDVSNMVIYRYKLSYDLAAQVNKTPYHFMAHFMPLLQEVVNEMAKVSTLKDKTLTIRRPGGEALFTESGDGTASYEIRFALLRST